MLKCLAAGADINRATYDATFTALHHALANGHFDCARSVHQILLGNNVFFFKSLFHLLTNIIVVSLKMWLLHFYNMSQKKKTMIPIKKNDMEFNSFQTNIVLYILKIESYKCFIYFVDKKLKT